jgi:hypothetical protein
MSENIILEILGDIRHEVYFAINDDETLEKVLNIIDERMEDYRGKYNDDIFNELIKEW